MDHDILPTTVLHWNYRGFTEFPIRLLKGDESEVTDIYLKENLISQIPNDIGKLIHLESLYLSGNDITELPTEISKLRYLKCLDISGNRLRRIPEDIGEMTRLKFLILDENELTELPLRLSEIRSLRYLSVCDNKLRWLPQRPVYNYHHCELRFWRNTSLRAIPYSLWYHMFRDQQTRSLNIGCLSIPHIQRCHAQDNTKRCKLKLSNRSQFWDFSIEFPPQHKMILTNKNCSPPSLFEISKRIFFQALTVAAKAKTTESWNDYTNCNKDHCYENGLASLGNDFKGINIDNGNMSCDFNGNNLASHGRYCYVNKQYRYCSPTDIIEEYFTFLPAFIKRDLSVGPLSRCENVSCKKPVFDYVFYEFCLGQIILIDNTEEVVLSAVFCSKICANAWRVGRSNLLSWTLEND